MSIRIIEFLANNSITEKRFNDAGQYFYLLATEYLNIVENPEHPTLKD